MKKEFKAPRKGEYSNILIREIEKPSQVLRNKHHKKELVLTSRMMHKRGYTGPSSS